MIHSVDKMWSRNTSTAQLTNTFRNFDLEFEEGYQVLCDATDSFLDVYNANGIPNAGSSFPDFPYVYCERAAPQQISPVYWIVIVNYKGQAGPNLDSPLLAPPDIDWDDVETEEEIDQDFDGKPIVTANNEPIEGVKCPVADQTLIISRNMAFFSPYMQARYRRAVNSDTFQGWPPGTARLMKLKAKNVRDPAAPNGYWKVNAVIQFRFPYRTTPAKAWYARVRHEGYYIREGGRIWRGLDERGDPVSKKVLLKADGTRETNPDNAYWLEIKRFDSLPFRALGLL